MNRIALLIAISCILQVLNSVAVADTIVTNDGRELKGIIVEDYKDRVTFSSESGETTIMKSDVREVLYDSEEDNLIKLAEQAKDAKEYEKAYGYYIMAQKVNPDSRAAQDGIIFLQGYLFRKDQQRKEEDMLLRAEMDGSRPRQEPVKSEEEKLAEMAETMKKSLGVTLKRMGGHFEFDTVLPDSAASQAGIRPGDLLVGVWGRLTGYMSLFEVSNILLEKPSLEMKCIIERILDVAINPDRGLVANPVALIGSELTMEFDGLTVSEVTGDGPSKSLGLAKDDLVTAIDGKSTRYMPLKNAIELIKNSTEDTVRLTIRREVTIWRRG